MIPSATSGIRLWKTFRINSSACCPSARFGNKTEKRWPSIFSVHRSPFCKLDWQRRSYRIRRTSRVGIGIAWSNFSKVLNRDRLRSKLPEDETSVCKQSAQVDRFFRQAPRLERFRESVRFIGRNNRICLAVTHLMPLSILRRLMLQKCNHGGRWSVCQAVTLVGSSPKPCVRF